MRPLRTLVALLLLAPATAQAQDVVVYFHTDAIGSVRVITDETGAVIHRYDYLPFGEPWNPPPNADTRRFAGQELDAETTLNYFGARYYRPQSGMFITGDPGHVGGHIFNPQSWNAYSYALNNPLRFVDLFGLAPSCPAPTDVSTCVEGRPGSGEFAYDWSRWVLETWIRHELNAIWTNLQDSFNGTPPPNGIYGGMPGPPLGGIVRALGARTIGRRTLGQIHHIATDKSIKSGYTKTLERIFERGGLSLQASVNKVFLEGHAGRHSPLYHQHVIDRLTNATSGLSGSAYRQALELELNAIRRELLANPGLVRGVGLR